VVRQPIFRWQVQVGESSLEALLERSGHLAALVEGRTFVDNLRVNSRLSLRPDQVVEVYAAKPHPEEPEILAEKAGILAVSKPVGWSTEPDRAGENSVVTWIAEKRGIPRAEVFAGSRLDSPVSGVLLLAVEPKAIKFLSQAKQAGGLTRSYLALLGGKPVAAEGTWRLQVHNKPAESHFSLLRSCSHRAFAHEGVSLVRLTPVTGRMHQLRIHSAAAGAPILGDVRNGGVRRFTQPNGEVEELARLMLHASAVSLLFRPGEPFSACAPVPLEMQRIWRALGGLDQDFLAESRPQT